MKENEMVYPLDRVIVTVSTIFFLMAIGVNYLLITRIFDAKIAAVCTILMLFSETLWTYSLSGLPQMLMLLLFSCGVYFAYRAVEAVSEGRLSMTPAVIAGVFFTLLALTHWIAVWIVIGYIIFAAVYFKPRGIVGLIVLTLMLLAALGPMLRNNSLTGTPFGTAFLILYNGMSSGSELSIMRTIDLGADPLDIEGLFSKICRTTLLQFNDIVLFLGGIIVAPLFFVSLLHPFKRPAIAQFRWVVASMWITGALGLAFFGISKDPLDPNQIHLLFAPIMTAYGLAFLSVLWGRLNFVMNAPILRNVHHIVVIGICALPLLLALPQKIKVGLSVRDRGGIPHWPPYYAPALNSQNSGLKAWVSEKQVTFSDQPWAVAWYADRMSIWLPPTREGFVKLEAAAAEQLTPCAGILISPVSHGSTGVTDMSVKYKDFLYFVLDGNSFYNNYPNGVSLFDKNPKVADIAKRYPYRAPLVGMDMVYYSDRPIRTAASQTK